MLIFVIFLEKIFPPKTNVESQTVISNLTLII